MGYSAQALPNGNGARDGGSAQGFDVRALETALRRAAIINAALVKMCVLDLPGLDRGQFHEAIDHAAMGLSRAMTPASLKLAVRQIALETERYIHKQQELISTREEEFTQTVTLLTDAVAEFGLTNESFAEQVLQRGERLGRATDTDDVQKLRQAVSEELQELREITLTKQREDAERMSSLSARVSLLEARLASAQEEATQDALTGLPNRASWDKRMREVDTQFASGQRNTAIAVIDLDNFKMINDSEGHRAGDEALVTFASIARGVIGKHGFLSRYGGDEFCVLMRAPTLTHASSYFDRLQELVRGHARELSSAGRRPFTISVGLAYSNERDTAATLLERADRAVYAAKAQGRDRIVIAMV